MKILLLLLLSVHAFAQAGPPLLTDDPGTPDLHSWEINFAVTTELSQEQNHLEAPIVDLNYGLTDHTQLKYEVPFVVANRAGEASETGFDQSIVGIKYRFLDKEKIGFSMSAYPQMTFFNPVMSSMKNAAMPEDAPSRDYVLPVEIEQQAGAFEFDEEVGYHWFPGDTNQFMGGVSANYPLKHGVLLLSELHGNALSNFSDAECVFNAGSTVELTRQFVLLISVGRSLKTFQGDPTRYLTYAGLQLLL